MKLNLLVSILLLLVFVTFSFAADNPQLRGKLGFGFQANSPTPGLSFKYEITDPLQLQGVFGIFGDNTYYGGRLLYGFKHEYHTAYIFATAAGRMMKNQTYQIALPGGMYETQTARQYGQIYGGGIGLEWFFHSFPELGICIDVGFANYNEPPGTANFASIIGGIGLHYYPVKNKK